jgi:hypothetical protein
MMQVYYATNYAAKLTVPVPAVMRVTLSEPTVDVVPVSPAPILIVT